MLIFALMQEVAQKTNDLSQQDFIAQVLQDYKIAYQSRHASLIGRKEVLTGKAKFGIFGDGKEIAQIAMAKVFEPGDWRSGYYRDQTFMFALELSNVQKFFAQLYAHASVEKEPASGGRSMNGHYATRLLDDNGHFLSQSDRYNVSADISPTAGQMPRLLGLAVASKLYKENELLHELTQFSQKGREIAFGTIGNASTSEGIFWEVMNAACVMQVPMLMSVWDDAYGISVPAKYQTAKENIGAIMKGFQTNEDGVGLHIITARGWNYPELCNAYREAADICREQHTPVLVHVTEVTQPQGHSTSGSHERYKSQERLDWEREYDCIEKMRQWMIENNIITADKLDELEKEHVNEVKIQQKQAWIDFSTDLKSDVTDFIKILDILIAKNIETASLTAIKEELQQLSDPIRRDLGNALHRTLRRLARFPREQKSELLDYHQQFVADNNDRYSSHLYSQSDENIHAVPQVPLELSDETADGYQVVRACFEANMDRDPRIFAFGEDVGKIGDVNQGFSGLQ